MFLFPSELSWAGASGGRSGLALGERIIARMLRFHLASGVRLAQQAFVPLSGALVVAVAEWTHAALDRGARVVVATHELEPFVVRAARAVWFADGRAWLCEPVTPQQAEALARGGTLPARVD